MEQARQDLLAAAAGLQVATERLTEKFKDVDAFSHETRRITEHLRRTGNHVKVVLLVLALVLVVIVVLLVRINRQNDQLARQAAYDVASCERGNVNRAGQRQQWLDTRDLLLRAGATPETRQLANSLVANAYKNFPPIDCAALTRGEDPAPVMVSPPA